LSRLYDALFPPFFSLGSPANWDQNLLPETSQAIDVVREWLRELVYTIDPRNQKMRFLTFSLQANTLSRLFDKTSFQTYIHRAQCMTGFKPREFMRNHNDYVLADCADFTIGKSHTGLAQGLMFAKYIDSILYGLQLC
jgi:hypothetical protein